MTARIDDTLKERGERYGSFEDNARTARDLKDAVRRSKRFALMPAVQQEAIDMILHKIARAINGDHTYDDNWVDIAGYATLVVEQLRGDNNEQDN